MSSGQKTRRKSFLSAEEIRGILFACSLGAILYSVTGNFVFIVLAGLGSLSGITIGKILHRIWKRAR